MPDTRQSFRLAASRTSLIATLFLGRQAQHSSLVLLESFSLLEKSRQPNGETRAFPVQLANVDEQEWDFTGYSQDRLFACLSPSNDCGFSVMPCPSNFFCQGSTPIESNLKPKEIKCTNIPPFQLHSKTGELTQPQTCTNGKWNGNNDWHLDVFCGFPCDKTCDFTNGIQYQPNFGNPPDLSDPDAKHTCPWTQCKDGAIYAWSGVQYERIPFKTAQCAKEGDPSLPWVIGSNRYASIQCYNGTANSCKDVIPTIDMCQAVATTCNTDDLLSNAVHVECDLSTLYVSESGTGPGVAMADKLTCYDGKWHGESVTGVHVSSEILHAACGKTTTCETPTPTNGICKSGQNCDFAPAKIDDENKFPYCPNNAQLVVSDAAMSGSGTVLKSNLTCVNGIWTGTTTSSTTFTASDLYYTCTLTCKDPTASDVICPTGFTCDKTLGKIENGVLFCTGDTTLVLAASVVANSGERAKGNATCIDGLWTGEKLSHPFAEPNGVYTCVHNKCTKATPDDSVCPPSQFCDSTTLITTTTDTSCPAANSPLFVSTTTNSAGAQADGNLTCTAGAWAGTFGSTQNISPIVFATCYTQLTTGCPNPIKTDAICTSSRECDSSEVYFNVSEGKLRCKNGEKLIVTASPSSTGSKADYMKCDKGKWDKANSVTAYVTCQV